MFIRRKWLIAWLASAAVFLAPGLAKAQCEIKNKIGIDGTMYYYLDPARFYWTEQKQLSGGLVTDEEHYFLVLLPFPFPEGKKESEKLRKAAQVKLSNEKTYKLEHFNSQFNVEDSSFRIMYLLSKETLEDFRKYEVESISMDMGPLGIVDYHLSLHKSALREHLKCFSDREAKK